MSNKSTASTTITRGRKGSVKDSLTLDDVSSLIRQSEERIKSCFKDEIAALTEKIATLENNLSVVQTECSRLDFEVTRMKDIITNQQLTIENH